MERSAETRSIEELLQEFPRIEFPEYQREPTVWNREQKQRLIDSILRSFDIAAVYFYVRADGGWECIDGRQRLNAIRSFLGENETDDDNGFSLRIHNEVAGEENPELLSLDGTTFAQLEPDNRFRAAILDYRLTTVLLTGSREPSEFNLQFLRLNLGTLINAGEKLHAMVGAMRDRIFDPPEGLGHHPFLGEVAVPTRRFARELMAAQIMLEISTQKERGEFARARHFDLQRYLKIYAEDEAPGVADLQETLDALQEHAPDLGPKLGNRAITVSVVLAAWQLDARTNPGLTTDFASFVEAFLLGLAEQVENMKTFQVDPRYPYLVEFQRHLTQAAVEKPAIAFRHKTLLEQFDVWRKTGKLEEVESGG